MNPIRAKQLVIAGGYESQNYLEQKITRLHSTYALVSEPFESEIWISPLLRWPWIDATTASYTVIHYPTPAEHIPKTTTRRKSEGT